MEVETRVKMRMVRAAWHGFEHLAYADSFNPCDPAYGGGHDNNYLLYK